MAFLLVCSCSFTLLFMVLVFKSLPDRLARTALVLFTVLPVSTTAYFWVSMDSVTLLLLLLALVCPECNSVIWLVGLALGMQHFEQAFFAIAGLLLATSLNHLVMVQTRYTARFCFALLAAVFLGKLLLILIFQHYTILVNSGRWYFMRQHLHEIISGFFLHAYEQIWAILGLGWLIALRYVDWGKQALPFFVGLLCLSSVLLLVGDQARVLAIITFPLVFAYWLLNREFLTKWSQAHVALIFLIWLVMPWYWLCGGVKGSVFFFDLGYLLHKAFGWFVLPNNLYAWPF